MNFGFFANSILLGAGLAMDAFSVSLANGLNEQKMSLSRMNCIAGVFGGFQFIMPMAGWLCVHTVIGIFGKLEKFIPWIALLLLLYIGIKMLVEGKENNVEKSVKTLSFSVLMVQGIATSIDALSVGFTIADYNLSDAIVACLIIGLVTHIICLFGLKIGKKVGVGLAEKASVLGGLILIGIGIEIFIKGVFF